MSDLTPDGYRIVPKLPEPHFGETIERGIQCGQCGMKFEYNQGYGYACQEPRCPIQLKPSF